VGTVEERSVVNRLAVPAVTVRRNYERVAGRIETFIQILEQRYTPLGRFTPGPFEGWSFLWQPALLGFVAMVLIVSGCSFTNSPFKLNMYNTWFYGEPTLNPAGTSSETKYIVSVVLVYGGLLLLMRVWLRLAEVMKLHRGASMKSLWWMLLLWAGPMIVAPPLFSRDVFSYAAQGEMTSHHLSPYILGPYSLGSSPYVNPVDPLWQNTPAPYGPLFLYLDGTMAKITHHNQLATVVGLRLLEIFAVALIGYGVIMLARELGRDPGEAFVLSAMNPLVLLTLIGGAHNDAIMAGLLVVGIALAVKRRPVWALVFCSCAAAIKAPAAMGLAYVAWTWLGPRATLKQRLRPIVSAGLVGRARDGNWTGHRSRTSSDWASLDLGELGAVDHAIPRAHDRDRFGDLAALALRASRMGPLARPLAAALRGARPGGAAVVLRLGARPARRQLSRPRALLAAAALNYRSLYWYSRRSPTSRRPPAQ
jgi:hypothetical protein